MSEQKAERNHQAEDPGAYIGREPERATETNPGEDPGGEPSGHRQGDRVSDDDVREAGQDH